jgi:hypothetical protein
MMPRGVMAQRCGHGREQWRQRFSDRTWLTAEKAVAKVLDTRSWWRNLKSKLHNLVEKDTPMGTGHPIVQHQPPDPYRYDGRRRGN